MKDVISVDSPVIALLHKCDHEPDEITKYVVIDQSEFVPQLHSLLISKLPDKKPLVFEKEYSTPRELLPQEQEIKLNTNHQVIGFNSAIDDMKAVLDELFEVKG